MALDEHWLHAVNDRLANVTWPQDSETTLDIELEFLDDGVTLTLHLGADGVTVGDTAALEPRLTVRIQARVSDLLERRVDVLGLLGGGRLSVHGGAGTLISLAPVLADVFPSVSSTD